MSITVRVATVRLQSPGRTIFTGKVVDSRGNLADARSYVVVTATRKVLGNFVEQGQWWSVSGETTSREVLANGFKLTEFNVDAETAQMERLSGEHLITYLARSPAFEGIGMVKARRLWDAFGEGLYAALDDGDLAALSKHLSQDVAAHAIAAWAVSGNSKSLKWLQDIGLDVSLGRKVLEFHGLLTPEKVTEDPYRLLSFCSKWTQVDQIATKTFGVQPNDPRRLQGAIEEACYAAFANGHTSVLSSDLESRLSKLLGRGAGSAARAAMEHGHSNGAFVVGPHGVQPLGAAVMEHVVARYLCRIALEVRPQIDAAALNTLMAEYEGAESIVLNKEQRQAVELANQRPLAILIGGAGVGKTTVLKAIYRVFDMAGLPVIPLALAGRAAKRMQEATGRPASTVASFIKNNRPGDLTAPAVVVIDEASMLDIVSMSAICERLSPSTRLLLIGDPSQLMPVGPGLVLHALVKVKEIPLVELMTVKRHEGPVLAAAQAIRGGRWPLLPSDVKEPIAFLPCDTGEQSLATTAVDLYAADPDDTQILVAKRHGAGGAETINRLAQQRFASMRPAVMTMGQEFTGFHVGDKLLCTRNLWDRGLQNGSMGVITRLEQTPVEQFDDRGRTTGWTLAWVEWDDGLFRPLVEEMLDDLTLGYAVTVHKAQGSQWKRIIVPIVPTRLLDRALLYTAVTRAQSQVILLGDDVAAELAVESLPRAETRSVALDLTARQMIDACRSNGLPGTGDDCRS